jgi:hypothetical protein
MADEFRIRDAPSDLVLEALRTVPIVPQYADFDFFAEGIAHSWPNETEATKANYIEQCKSKRLFLFLELTLELGRDY